MGATQKMVVQCRDFENTGNHAGKLTRVYASYLESKFTGDERDELIGREQKEIDDRFQQMREE